MTPVLVFDIETIPDVAGLRRVWDLSDDVSEQGVVDLVSQRRRQATGSDFMPIHLQRVVAISCVLRSNDGICAWSLGTAQDPEYRFARRRHDVHPRVARHANDRPRRDLVQLEPLEHRHAWRRT